MFPGTNTTQYCYWPRTVSKYESRNSSNLVLACPRRRLKIWKTPSTGFFDMKKEGRYKIKQTRYEYQVSKHFGN